MMDRMHPNDLRALAVLIGVAIGRRADEVEKWVDGWLAAHPREGQVEQATVPPVFPPPEHPGPEPDTLRSGEALWQACFALRMSAHCTEVDNDYLSDCMTDWRSAVGPACEGKCAESAPKCDTPTPDERLENPLRLPWHTESDFPTRVFNCDRSEVAHPDTERVAEAIIRWSRMAGPVDALLARIDGGMFPALADQVAAVVAARDGGEK